MKRIIWYPKIKLWEIYSDRGNTYFISLNGNEIAAQHGIKIEIYGK